MHQVKEEDQTHSIIKAINLWGKLRATKASSIALHDRWLGLFKVNFNRYKSFFFPLEPYRECGKFWATRMLT